MQLTDKFQIVLLRLAEQIHEKEAAVDRLNKELEELRDKVNKLDEARAILIEENGSAQEVTYKKAVESRPEFSLQEEILKCLQHSLVPAKGLTVQQVRKLLVANGYPVTSDKNFYSAVYMTLKRLAEKLEVESIEDAGERRFRPKNLTVEMF